ncbi:MAG: hypothetical protein AB7O62_23385 [Pirellulales bacterium]
MRQRVVTCHAAALAVLLGMMVFLAAHAADQDGQDDPKDNAPQEETFGLADKNDAGEAAVGPVWPAQSLIGATVSSQTGEDLGAIRALVLDLDDASLVLAMVKSPDQELDEERLKPIPWEVLASQGESKDGLTRRFTLAADLADLKAVEAIDRATSISRQELDSIRARYGLKARADQIRLMETTWGARGPLGRLFNTDSVRTIVGNVVEVTDGPAQPDMADGTNIRVETESGTVQVHLGPVRSLLRQHARFQRGDKVQVTGSDVDVAGKPAFMASRIARGRRAWRLRGDDGVPLWSRPSAENPHDLKWWNKLNEQEVRAPDNQRLGRIADLAIVPDTGAIAYVALETPDSRTNTFHPVPLSAFIVPPGQKDWLLELPRENINETATFTLPDWPQTIDRGWAEYVFVRYGRSPFDGVGDELRAEKQPR